MAYPPVSPAAWWKFNENSGSNAADSSGNGYDLTLTSGAAWNAPGKWGAAALNLDAGTGDPDSTGYAVSGGSTVGNYGLDDAFAFSLWFKVAVSSSPTYQAMISKINSSGVGYQFLLGPGGGLTMYLGTATAYWLLTNSTNRVDGNWHHLLVNFPGTHVYTDLEFYIDNSLQTMSQANSGSPTNITNAAALEVGNASVNSYPFQGYIDEVLLFSSYLSSGDRSALYAGPPASTLFRRTMFRRAGSRGAA